MNRVNMVKIILILVISSFVFTGAVFLRRTKEISTIVREVGGEKGFSTEAVVNGVDAKIDVYKLDDIAVRKFFASVGVDGYRGEYFSGSLPAPYNNMYMICMPSLDAYTVMCVSGLLDQKGVAEWLLDENIRPLDGEVSFSVRMRERNTSVCIVDTVVEPIRFVEDMHNVLVGQGWVPETPGGGEISCAFYTKGREIILVSAARVKNESVRAIIMHKSS